MQRSLETPPQNTPRATARVTRFYSGLLTQSGTPPRIALFAFGEGCRLKAVRLLGVSSAPLRLCASLLCISLFACNASAGETYTPPPAFDSWLANAFYAVALLTAVVVLIQRIFPTRKPAIEAEFVSKADLEKHCSSRHGELDLFRLDIRSQIAGVAERIEKMRLELSTAIASHNVVDEDRVKDLHQRLNPFTEETAALRRSMDNHLQDHRSRKT